jgi:hypothetical protein
MNFIEKIFKKSKSHTDSNYENDMNTPTAATETDQLLEKLFVDNNPPISDDGLEKQDNKITKFLKYDYRNEGYRDGYNFHSSEILEMKLKTIKSAFRVVIDEQSELLNDEVLKLKNHLIECEGLTTMLTKKLELRIEELNNKINRLLNEKELSSEDEGLVMKVVNQYMESYIRGVEDYQVEKLFGSDTALFV